MAQRQGEFTIDLPCVGDISVGGNVEGISATGHGSAAGNSYTIVFDIRIVAVISYYIT